MITRFEEGKKYRYLGTERPFVWSDDGAMDFMLDGEPHLCVYAGEFHDFVADFEGHERFLNEEELVFAKAIFGDGIEHRGFAWDRENFEEVED